MRSLGSGQSVSILAGEEEAGEWGVWRAKEAKVPLRVRAAVRLFGYDDARGRAVKSNWVEAPIAWGAP